PGSRGPGPRLRRLDGAIARAVLGGVTLRRRNRQLQRKGAPLALDRGHGDFAALEAGQLSAQEQPESSALQVLGLGGDDPAETGEQRRHAVAGDADALVVDRHLREARPGAALARGGPSL